MLNEITSFTPTTINGTLDIDGLVASVFVSEQQISGNIPFVDTPGQYLSISLDIATNKTSVSFNSDDSAKVFSLIETLSAKLREIQTELIA